MRKGWRGAVAALVEAEGIVDGGRGARVDCAALQVAYGVAEGEPPSGAIELLLRDGMRRGGRPEEEEEEKE